jgi:L-ascorbate metabolism protein UlaG (beta-lactamase superfamily)
MPDIQYLGHASVRLRGKEGIIVTDPFAQSDLWENSRVTAHIATLSGSEPRRSNTEIVDPVTERVFVIDGPGEYEVGGIMINGIRTYRDGSRGADHGRNTVYVLRLDEVVFCHLGDLGHELDTHQIEEIGAIDVLFVPAYSSLTPAQLTEVISAIEPGIVVPLYDEPAQLERLAHELGHKEWEAQVKLTVTSTTLPAEGEETRVIVMQPISKAIVAR